MIRRFLGAVFVAVVIAVVLAQTQTVDAFWMETGWWTFPFGFIW